MTAVPRPKAYSYIRFSTPEQAQGDSLRRQIEAARAYAAKLGMELDEELTFRDHGVSAFQGRNAAEGALKLFLDAVREGRVAQGSYLLVEALDRVSRQTVRRAVRTMEDIVVAGVNLVDLSDGGRVYNADTLDNDPMGFLVMAIRFMRAHEESATKARRVLAAYENKRAQARNGSAKGRPFTRMLPAWLRWDEGASEHVAIHERAKVVRNIFKKAEEGWGQHRIAHWLNEQGIEPWGLGKRKAAHWHRSYVKKILTNRAVVGTFTPHRAQKDETGRRRRIPQEPIEDYFPAVVDRELFERVAARVRATAPRGRHAASAPASIFAGILKCVHCEGTVGRVCKGEHVYLVCSKAHARANGCKYQTVPYADVEGAIRQNARLIVEGAPRGRDTTELEAEIARQDELVSTLADEARDLVDELLQEKSEAARRRLRDKERELERAREAVRDLRASRNTLTKGYVLRRLEALLESLGREPFSVSEANRALREAVRKIVLDPEERTLVMYWHHAEEPSEDIPFSSGRVFGPLRS